MRCHIFSKMSEDTEYNKYEEEILQAYEKGELKPNNSQIDYQVIARKTRESNLEKTSCN